MHDIVHGINICFCFSVESMDFTGGISNPTDFNLRLPGSHNSHHKCHDFQNIGSHHLGIHNHDVALE